MSVQNDLLFQDSLPWQWDRTTPQYCTALVTVQAYEKLPVTFRQEMVPPFEDTRVVITFDANKLKTFTQVLNHETSSNLFVSTLWDMLDNYNANYNTGGLALTLRPKLKSLTKEAKQHLELFMQYLAEIRGYDYELRTYVGMDERFYNLNVVDIPEEQKGLELKPLESRPIYSDAIPEVLSAVDLEESDINYQTLISMQEQASWEYTTNVTAAAFGEPQILSVNTDNSRYTVTKVLTTLSPVDDEEHSFEMETATGNIDGAYIGDIETAKSICDKYGINPIKHPSASIGKSDKDGKWYGWSHRGIYGVKVGEKITPKMDLLYMEKRKENKDGSYVIKDEDDAKKHAILYSQNVS